MDAEKIVEISEGELTQITCNIVTAYVSNNALGASEIPGVIDSVHRSLKALTVGQAEAETKQKPAVTIRRSVTPDFIICLEDGRKLKMLKRYLRTRYDMTPEEYREKWGLRADYPMVAPNYSAQRTALAKKIGLGKKGRAAKKSGRKRRK